MEFDEATSSYYSNSNLRMANAETVMESIELKFAAHGLRMPKLVYWDVDARQNNIPMIGNHLVSYVSGFSPSIFTSILTGKTGWDLMLEAITAPRYECIHA